MNSIAGLSAARMEGEVGVRGTENVDDVDEWGGVRYGPLLDEPFDKDLTWRSVGRLGSGGATLPSSLARFGLEVDADPEGGAS